MKNIKKNEGFTLVELIVVIAILGILAGIAVPAYSGYISKANEAGDLVALDAIKTAAIFAIVEDNSPNSAEVTELTVTPNSNEVSYKATISGSESTGKVDVSDYTTVPAAFKSEKFKTGAKWTAADQKWDKPTQAAGG